MFSMVASAMTDWASIMAFSLPFSCLRNFDILRLLLLGLQSHTWAHKHSQKCISERKMGKLIFVLEALHEPGQWRGYGLVCPVFHSQEGKDLHNIHTASYSVSTGVKRPERAAGHLSQRALW
jgi:hypothetical protein